MASPIDLVGVFGQFIHIMIYVVIIILAISLFRSIFRAVRGRTTRFPSILARIKGR